MAKQETPKIQEVKAHARYIHVSPRKLRLVADLIRKARVDVALEQLRYSAKSAALPITKVLNSAVANAVHNHNWNREDLVVKAITVDGGPVMKRMFPRAQGSASVIRRRMSHINVILESRPKTKSKKSKTMFQAITGPSKDKQADKEAKAEKDEAVEGKIEGKNDKARTAPKSGEKIKRQTNALKRRLFNRKSGE
jgi:large subunit ribosomal protein L22